MHLRIGEGSIQMEVVNKCAWEANNFMLCVSVTLKLALTWFSHCSWTTVIIDAKDLSNDSTIIHMTTHRLWCINSTNKLNRSQTHQLEIWKEDCMANLITLCAGFINTTSMWISYAHGGGQNTGFAPKNFLKETLIQVLFCCVLFWECNIRFVM